MFSLVCVAMLLSFILPSKRLRVDQIQNVPRYVKLWNPEAWDPSSPDHPEIKSLTSTHLQSAGEERDQDELH